MSKITVRADDDLVERLEALDASKSQVVREALRAYLDDEDVVVGANSLTDDDVIQDADGGVVDSSGRSLDALVTERVDELVSARLDDALESHGVVGRREPQDVNVNVTVDGAATQDSEAATTVDAESDDAVSDDSDVARTPADRVRDDDVDASPSSSCAQCGSEVDADHVYCPNCGEKATRRAFCECGDEVRSDWAFCPSCGRRTPAADVLDSG
jgi:predicted transcriptional regulator/predicted RNA-binding Zn-ribbon protein involved in translation (DUF1610 family)